MQLIDFHAHIYPEAIAKKATQSVCDFYHLHTRYTGTPEEKSKVDETAGIIRSAALPVAVLPRHVLHVNEFIEKTARENPHFIPFATVHAGDENILESAATFKKRGFAGIKMHPDMQRFDIDDKRLYPLYDLIGDSLPFVFHSGDPRSAYSHPEKILKVMKDFPRLIVVASHLGGWCMQPTAFPLLGKMENCFVDTSSSMSHMTKDRAEKYIRGYGIERVFFGTDYPVEDPLHQIRVLMDMPFTDDEKEKIAHGNAEKFLQFFK